VFSCTFSRRGEIHRQASGGAGVSFFWGGGGGGPRPGDNFFFRGEVIPPSPPGPGTLAPLYFGPPFLFWTKPTPPFLLDQTTRPFSGSFPPYWKKTPPFRLFPIFRLCRSFPPRKDNPNLNGFSKPPLFPRGICFLILF